MDTDDQRCLSKKKVVRMARRAASPARMAILIFMICIGLACRPIMDFSIYQKAYMADQNQDPSSVQAFLEEEDALIDNGVRTEVNTRSDGQGAFHQFLATFQWNKPWAEDEWQSFFLGLSDFNYMEPQVAIDSTCLPPALLTPDEIRCEDYPTAQFKGKRKQPAKVGHAIQFGFDVDTLEIHLNELYDVVDKFFIVEWTESHNAQFNPKPLSLTLE